MNKTQCVIFDCEGTLVDSEVLCCRALSRVFESYGAQLSVEEAMNNFVGGKLADILTETRDRLGLTLSLDIIEPRYREILQQLFESELKPMPGAKTVLDSLNKKGIDYCVVSNGPRDKIEQALKLTDLHSYFSGRIFSAFDTNSWKPEPDSILYSAMSMGYKPDQCLYVDDTPKGLEAGVRAGIRTVHIQGINKQSYPGIIGSIKQLHQIESYI